jgi:hypothetical protein
MRCLFVGLLLTVSASASLAQGNPFQGVLVNWDLADRHTLGDSTSGHAFR